MARFSMVAMMPSPPRVLKRAEAEEYVGGETHLDDLIEAKWVKPLIERHRDVSFDRAALDAAVDRAGLEGWPPPAKRRWSDRKKT